MAEQRTEVKGRLDMEEVTRILAQKTQTFSKRQGKEALSKWSPGGRIMDMETGKTQEA